MKKGIYIFAVLLGSMLSISGKAQKLDKPAMYADFDEFVSLIESCSGELAFRKTTTGFDQMFAIKTLRDCIDTVTSDEGFFSLLRFGLGYLYDEGSKESYVIPANLEGCVKVNTSVFPVLQKQLEWSKRRLKTFGSHIIYYQGDYFLQGSYTYILLSTDDTVFLENPRIIEYEEEPFREYVQRSLPLFSQSGTHWDAERNEYYSTTAFIPDEGTLLLESQGVKIKLDLNEPYLAQINEGGLHTYSGIPPSSYPSTSKKVIYFKGGKTLYIYLDNFNDLEKQVLRKIKEIKYPVNKVILDIRDNKGGDPKMWQEVLEAIISEPQSFHTQTIIKNSLILREKLENCAVYKDGLKEAEEVHFSEFPEETFWKIQENTIRLVPNSQSIKYSGPIYILINENLSGTATLLPSFAEANKQLISIGIPTGQLISSSYPALMFQLPNSAFTFTLTVAVEVTDHITPSAIFQTDTEINSNYVLKDWIKTKQDRLRYEQQSEKYLKKHDPLFKVLQKIP